MSHSPALEFSYLLSYPDGEVKARAALAADSAMRASHPAQEGMESFAIFAAGATRQELEEAYTRAFDLNPAATLEVGWHLFGETYKRGQFLAYLKRELESRGIDAGTRLPDDFTLLLKLYDALPQEDAAGLVVDCLLPAVDKILSAIGDSPYMPLMKALQSWLAQHLGDTPPTRHTITLPILTELPPQPGESDHA